eukprot:5887277-Prymnesium_polylepis.1
MISPETRQSFLLSSSTVFIDSIQIASTGPSKTMNWRSILPNWVYSATAWRGWHAQKRGRRDRP